MKLELKLREKVLLISISLAVGLLGLGFLLGDVGILGFFLILAAMIVFPPQMLLIWMEHVKLKDIETSFPTFLRDIVEGLRAGLPLHEAMMSCKRVRYGRLDPEVRLMANQLSWGIPVESVLKNFSKRVKRSKKLRMAIRTIIESYMAGGDVISTLEGVAENLNKLEEAERERRMLLSQYTLIMYAICLLFLGILVGINKLLVPVFAEIGVERIPGALGIGMGSLGQNPCLRLPNFPACRILLPFCSAFKLKLEAIGCYYSFLFFVAGMVQAVVSGLAAGQMAEGSLKVGLKHSFILVLLVLGSFLLLIWFKWLG